MSNQVVCRVVENTQVQVSTERHSWIADEPAELKGDGLGPNPFDHLLAALGTCTALEVSLTAAHAKVPLELTQVEVTGEWDRDGDKPRYRIRRTVRVRGRIEDPDVERIRRWAEKCPVGHILEKGALLETAVERL